MKNLVIMYCTGYPQEIYDRFIVSLYNTGYQSDLIILINESDIPKIQKNIDVYGEKVKYVVCVNVPNFNIYIARGILIYRILISLKEKYNHVFVCDSRDVFFQKDIFNGILRYFPCDLWLFQEENILIKDCPFNSRWLRDIGDNEKFDLIKEKPVICAATILGSYEGMIKYYQVFLSTLVSLNNPQNQTVDQGIHNYIYYSGLLTRNLNVAVLTNEDNLVNTVGYGFKGLNDDGQVVNKNGDVSYCIHQYDRFSPDLINRISKLHNLNFNL